MTATLTPDLHNNPYDVQYGGNHYKQFVIQPLEFTVKNNLSFPQGCVVKYVTRFEDKGGLEDLRKAKHYLEVIAFEKYGCKDL